MRVVGERPVWMQMATVLVGFFLGPFSALRLSTALAPESDVVQTVGALAFAFVFVGGSMLWMGLGVAAVVIGALWSLIRGRLPGPPSAGTSDTIVPPGYRSYVVLGTGVGVVVGLLTGVVTDLGFLAATGVWVLLGTGYGLVLWAAAHHGFLPFPEPE